MNVQLFPSNYEGNPIDVYCQDPNALCQYLYDYAQNQLQTIVQLGYQLPGGDQGVVDPSWPVVELVKAGAQFLVMINQDNASMQNQNVQGNGEIALNIYVNDFQVTQIQATMQQSLQDILVFVNQNMQSQFNTLELYDSTGVGLSNNPLDIIGLYAQHQSPLLMFIPGCQSGIQNFVQEIPQILDIPSQEQKSTQVQIEVFQNDQKIAELEQEQTTTLQQILEFVNQSIGAQFNAVELYDKESVGRSNNPMDKLEQYIQFPQPFKIIVKQTIHVVIYLNQSIYVELDASSNQFLQEILDVVNSQENGNFSTIELFDQNGQKLSDNPQDLFEKFLSSQQPLNGYIPSKFIQKALPVIQQFPVQNQNQEQMQLFSNFDQSQINKNPQQTGNLINQSNFDQPPNLASIDTQFINFQIQNPVPIPLQPQQLIQESQQSPQMKIPSNNIVQNQPYSNPQPPSVPLDQSPQQQNVQPPTFPPIQPKKELNIQPPVYSPIQPPQQQNVQPQVQPPKEFNIQSPIQPPVQPPFQPYVQQAIQPAAFNNIVNDDQDPFKTIHVNPQQIQQNTQNIQQQQANPFPKPQSFSIQPNTQNQNNLNLVPPPFNPQQPQQQFQQPQQQFPLPQQQYPQQQQQVIPQPQQQQAFPQTSVVKQNNQINQNIQQQPFQQSNISNPPFAPMKLNSQIVQKDNFPNFNQVQSKTNQTLNKEPNIKQQIQNVKDSLKVQKTFTLTLDQSGEFVVYKFHFPFMISGSLTKADSKSQFKQNTANLDWVKCNNISFAEIDDYSFAIKWSNNNISIVKINIL